ncbi:Hypothetical protein FKW44_025167, partial [Caligus rogercresseyi]
YSFQKLSRQDPSFAFNAIIEDVFDDNVTLNVASHDATQVNFIQLIRSLSQDRSTYVFLSKRSEKYLLKSSITRLKKIRRWKELKKGQETGIRLLSSLHEEEEEDATAHAREEEEEEDFLESKARNLWKKMI